MRAFRSIFLSVLFLFLLVWNSPVVSDDGLPDDLSEVTNLSEDRLDSIFRMLGGGTSASGAPFLNGTAIPVYGNWCGPNYGSGTPIDEVDRACQTHDLCYTRSGYFDCRCDNQLVKNLRKAIRKSKNLKTKAAGTLIRGFFSDFPCLCRRQVKCGTGCTTCTDWNGMAQWPCNCTSTRGKGKCQATIPTEKNTRCKA